MLSILSSNILSLQITIDRSIHLLQNGSVVVSFYTFIFLEKITPKLCNFMKTAHFGTLKLICGGKNKCCQYLSFKSIADSHFAAGSTVTLFCSFRKAIGKNLFFLIFKFVYTYFFLIHHFYQIIFIMQLWVLIKLRNIKLYAFIGILPSKITF